MKKIRFILFFLGAALIAVLLWFGVQGNRNRVILNRRISDVKLLMQVYQQIPNATNIDQLFSVLSQKGIALNNPIPKDPAKPCYRFVSRNDSAFLSPNFPIIEEVNVTDEHHIVISTLDGSVSLLKKTEK